MERDKDAAKTVKKMLISTHALTWSATKVLPFWDVTKRISTHALTWSATDSVHLPYISLFFISTHALTWSAT